MPYYKLKFEFFGRRMQTTVEATNRADAMKKIALRIHFDSVEEEAETDIPTLDELMNILGLKKKPKG